MPEPATSRTNETAAPAKKGGWWRKLFASIIILFAVFLVVVFASYQVSHPTTNDISVQAYIIGVTARVSGPIVKKHFRENQYVKEGDLLFEIDPSTFEAVYDKALAEKKHAFDFVATLEAGVISAQTQVKTIQVDLTNQMDILTRYEGMLKDGAIAEIPYQNQQTKVNSTQQALNEAQSSLIAAQAQLSSTVQSNPIHKAAEAALKSAELNLSYAKVYAPKSGYITNENIQEGTYVNEGKALFALVVDGDWWVNARFKETQIRIIHNGDPVKIYLKMYPQLILEGEVSGTGWAIYQEDGATVQMLPKIDPTVDWVRLANRYNVRIHIKNLDKNKPLRIGATGVVVVDSDRMD